MLEVTLKNTCKFRLPFDFTIACEKHVTTENFQLQSEKPFAIAAHQLVISFGGHGQDTVPIQAGHHRHGQEGKVDQMLHRVEQGR